MGIAKILSGAASAAAMLALMPGAALSQEGPATLQDFRLDPSRDTNQPKAPERAGPEIRNIPPPVPLPQVNAPQVTMPPATTAPSAPPPAVTKTVPTTAAPRPERRAEPEPQISTPATPDPAPAPTEVAPATLEPSASPTVNLTAETPQPAPQPSSTFPWMLVGIVGGLMALALAMILWRRSHKPDDYALVHHVQDEVAPAPAPLSDPVRPAPQTRVTPVRAVPPASGVTIEFKPVYARTTLIGASIGYRLVLRNEGDAPIRDVKVANFIANADADQQRALSAFFAEAVAMAAHTASEIAPGASATFNGEARLDREHLRPIEVQGRALLIPVVAFTATYNDGKATAAFIIGQESTPPRAKMGAFRLDQGPRQFRDIGSRPAQGLIAA